MLATQSLSVIITAIITNKKILIITAATYINQGEI